MIGSCKLREARLFESLTKDEYREKGGESLVAAPEFTIRTHLLRMRNETVTGAIRRRIASHDLQCAVEPVRTSAARANAAIIGLLKWIKFSLVEEHALSQAIGVEIGTVNIALVADCVNDG